MAALSESRTIAVSIARSPADVYDFVVAPEHLPDWAPGFAQVVRRKGDAWTVDTADGPMAIEFAERNAFGVADHTVTEPDGKRTLNPMRVLENGHGAEVIFTLLRRADQTDEAFAEDAAFVGQDLVRLKQLLES